VLRRIEELEVGGGEEDLVVVDRKHRARGRRRRGFGAAATFVSPHRSHGEILRGQVDESFHAAYVNSAGAWPRLPKIGFGHIVEGRRVG